MGGSSSSSEEEEINDDMQTAIHHSMADFIMSNEAGNQLSNSEDESDSELHSEFRKQMSKMVPRLLSEKVRSAKEDEVDNFGLDSITQGMSFLAHRIRRLTR